MLKKILNQKGETIVEVVIAIGVVAAALAFLTTNMISVSNLGYSSQAREQAGKIAKQTMEAIYIARDTDRCNFYNLIPVTNTIKYFQINSTGLLDLTAGGSSDIPFTRDVTGLFNTDGQSVIWASREIALRKTSISPFGDAQAVEGIQAEVVIRWQTKGIGHDQIYRTTAFLTNWRGL
jgi:type II secretory pathway pseudopilin PulG